MEIKESLSVKIIKRVYGVTGVLDEYRKGKIDEVGNQAFMLLYWYIPLSTFLAILFIEENPKIALVTLISSNMFIYMGISIYIVWKISRLKLMDIEVEKDKLKSTKRQLIIKNIGAAIYFSIAMYLLNALITVMMDGGSYLSELGSWDHIKWSLLSGLFFGLFMLIISFKRLKKIDEG